MTGKELRWDRQAQLARKLQVRREVAKSKKGLETAIANYIKAANLPPSIPDILTEVYWDIWKMEEAGKTTLDDHGHLIWTAVDNPKLRKLVAESKPV